MRRLAAVLLLCTLTACGSGGGGGDGGAGGGGAAGSGEEPDILATLPPPKPAVTRSGTPPLSCGGTEVRVPAAPAGLTREGGFSRLDSLRRPLKVKGRIWSDDDERLYVGVVCGVRTAERFATLVGKATLTAYHGKPALRWTTRTGVRSFMWLEEPGTAVYIGATPGLTSEIKPLATDITAG
ncbi:hypothetical protein [Nonomuraea candida]|uniref:hypothetical protein n=1 Tax=Nonomuraea candida TaxID=359159 RepID=UPI0005BB4B96|nr:hypothetical protein [Nonomuraea candida]